MPGEGDPPVASVSAVSVKLPPFWPSDPDLWFAQVKAQFATRGITVEQTKYEYIVSALAPDTATTVRDLILTPPANTPYTTLKRELIKRTGDPTSKNSRSFSMRSSWATKSQHSFCVACGSSGARTLVRTS